MKGIFRVVVLAGERREGGPLMREFDLPASVFVDIAGQPCLQRVMNCLSASTMLGDGVICGPDRNVIAAHTEIGALLAEHNFRWVAPGEGPAASAIAAIESMQPVSREAPVFLTTGDHALLRPETVDHFCRDALRMPHKPDFVVGLVPYESVLNAYPETRRTVIRFADGNYCGSNLFAILSPQGTRVLNFWRSMERMRKRPWKLAAALGWKTLLRYGSGRLSADAAMAHIGASAGCRLSWLMLDDPRAAIDVDSVGDWRLANRILSTPG